VNVQYASLTELATPAANVSAFCQAVISRVIPNGFWGQDAVQEHNKTCFLNKVDHFVHLRRFESMYLHEMMQGMKVGAITVLTSQVILTVLQINDIEWLTPPGLGNQKSSQSDTRKRTEIFYEFLYYLIDSFLIPLIRSNFYVTESNVDRYRLFFFRHDVWRYVAEPALAVLKTTMFEEVRMEDARQILQSRRLGYSQVRLLPKQMKMRPIMNLRRRTLLQGNKRLLGPSINTILGPVSSVLKLEKVSHCS
jgi:telomerase reverse transcriptase